VFVACTHWAPPFNHAGLGVLLVLFPFYVRPQESPEMQALPRWKRLRHATWHGLEWRQRMRGYQSRVAISPFTREWTRRRWHIDTTVVPPPVDTGFPIVRKRQQILAVGRYSTMAHTKKQLEMARTFRRLVDNGLTGWQFVCVGGLNTRVENQRYFEEVRQTLAGYPATIAANVPHNELRQLFAESRLFWHATGCGDDTEMRPELAEHFGIAPVEAMAAGCVPLVVDKGGPADLVTHDVTGVRWRTLDELAAWTRQLSTNLPRLDAMAAAARHAAADYSTDRFLNRFSTACGLS
jgi:L-malate glycosyltransferase